MVKNRKIIFATIIITVFVVIIIILLNRDRIKREEEFKRELELLYEDETFALGMDTYNCYRDFSYVDVNWLIISLASYNHYTKEELSVEEVKDFLSSEYDDNGELYVLNPPEKIAKFIIWSKSGGRSLTGEYYIHLCRFQDDNSEKYTLKSALIMDEEKLYELIEDFENCPNREEYDNFF